jgi:hypothetical protein
LWRIWPSQQCWGLDKKLLHDPHIAISPKVVWLLFLPSSGLLGIFNPTTGIWAELLLYSHLHNIHLIFFPFGGLEYELCPFLPLSNAELRIIEDTHPIKSLFKLTDTFRTRLHRSYLYIPLAKLSAKNFRTESWWPIWVEYLDPLQEYLLWTDDRVIDSLQIK